MPLTARTRIDLGVAATVIAIGAVFAFEAWRIDPASYEAVGPRAVPLFLAVAMIVLGASIGLGAWWRVGHGTPPEPGFGFADSDLRRVAAVIGAGAVYTFAFWAMGYMMATILGMAMALWVFGVRSPVMLVVLPLIAGIAYQVIFMGYMGLLDPRGALLNLRWLSNPVTPR
ncbi:tripartite tricarboxylate transporter TctB family protein [Jannaschia sp. KMU-145]|uniref:tripartite tricarboxylate transporter TctB family protein n=1 Tax=Jannaschia halovivens TaxID=3388667 RepID=UPI00396B0EB4